MTQEAVDTGDTFRADDGAFDRLASFGEGIDRDHPGDGEVKEFDRRAGDDEGGSCREVDGREEARDCPELFARHPREDEITWLQVVDLVELVD